MAALRAAVVEKIGLALASIALMAVFTAEVILGLSESDGIAHPLMGVSVLKLLHTS